MQIVSIVIVVFSAIAQATLPLWPLPRHIEIGSSTLWIRRDVEFSYQSSRNLLNFVGWLWDSAQPPNLLVDTTHEDLGRTLIESTAKVQLEVDRHLT